MKVLVAALIALAFLPGAYLSVKNDGRWILTILALCVPWAGFLYLIGFFEAVL